MENIPMSQEELEEDAPKWDEFLKKTKENLYNYNEKDIINVTQDLNEFINIIMNIKHNFKLSLPQDYITKANELLNEIMYVDMGKDGKKWITFLSNRITLLKDILNDRRTLNKDIMRDLLTNLSKSVMDTFEKYEDIFSSENSVLKEEAERAISGLERKYGISLLNYEPFEVETITSDKVLDLYEEIEKMSPGEEKEKKKKLLQTWQKQLVSFIKNKKIISARDEEEKEAIEEGMKEYYEQD